MRANPRHNISEISEVIEPMYKMENNYTPAHFKAHYKATLIEFNKAHPLQDHLKDEYV